MLHGLNTREPVAQSIVECMTSHMDTVDEQVVSEEKFTDEDIIFMVCFDLTQNNATDDSKREAQSLEVSAAEALSVLRKLISFQEQLEDGRGFTPDELDMLRCR